jgi:hypothetical protein
MFMSRWTSLRGGRPPTAGATPRPGGGARRELRPRRWPSQWRPAGARARKRPPAPWSPGAAAAELGGEVDASSRSFCRARSARRPRPAPAARGQERARPFSISRRARPDHALDHAARSIQVGGEEPRRLAPLPHRRECRLVVSPPPTTTSSRRPLCAATTRSARRTTSSGTRRRRPAPPAPRSRPHSSSASGGWYPTSNASASPVAVSAARRAGARRDRLDVWNPTPRF